MGRLPSAVVSAAALFLDAGVPKPVVLEIATEPFDNANAVPVEEARR
ncbi:MAG TPA: hypothetical protein VHM47_04660 [Actinomycetota bacterium]|nr:hypothetical protein [Actinomycetota bacterium]